MQKSLFTAVLLAAICTSPSFSQALRIPEITNTVCMTGRKVGVTEIQVHYSTPGVNKIKTF